MQTDEYGRLFAFEDHYWWFVARRSLALQLLKRAQAGHDVLDLGCGTGAVLGELSKHERAMGLDRYDVALKFCRERGLRELAVADAEQIPLQNESLDAVIGLDVFEHVNGDEAAFAEVYRVLRPEGALVLTVPAFEWLWGPHDEALMHFRRYTMKEMIDKLFRAGFEIDVISYSVFFLFPVVLVLRLLDKRKKGPPSVHLPSAPTWLNRLLIRLQALESRLLMVLRLPWGSSVVVLARKPADEAAPAGAGGG